MTKLRALLLFVLVLVLAGAGWFTCSYLRRVQPEPPPRGASEAAAPASASESSLRVPIAVDVGLIAGIAEQQVPRQLLARDDVPAASGMTVDVVVRRTDTISVDAARGKLELHVPVEADIKADWRPEGLIGLVSRGKRQHIDTRAAFTIHVEMSLGVDEQWDLATTSVATLRWDEDPVVELGPARVQLSALAGDRIREQFDAFVRTLDARLRERVPTRALLTQAWDAAFRSLPVDPASDLWLVMRPTGMSLGEVETRDGQVFLDAEVHGVLRAVVGEAPPAPEPTPLPTRSTPPAGEGIALDVPVSITFEAANRQLDERVEGQVLDVPLDVVGRSVPLTIESVEVYPSGAHIAVALDISADLPGSWFDLSGQVYLVGTPQVDPRSDRLWISDLAYDSRTNVALVDVAEWLLHEQIVRRVQGLLVFHLAGRIEPYRARVNAAIADYRVSDSIRLRGELADARVAAITVTDPAIVAVVALRGEARLELAQPRHHRAHTNAQ